MLNEGNQIHNIISSSGSGTVTNYGSGSDFLMSYGSGSTRQKVMVPTVPVTREKAVLWIRIRIRIRSDPELFAGSGLGSGINHFGSESGQSGSGMNLILNFSVKK